MYREPTILLVVNITQGTGWGWGRLVDFGLEGQDKEMDVRRLINDNDAIAEHLLCAKHGAPRTLSNLMFATIL